MESKLSIVAIITNEQQAPNHHARISLDLSYSTNPEGPKRESSILGRQLVYGAVIVIARPNIELQRVKLLVSDELQEIALYPPNRP